MIIVVYLRGITSYKYIGKNTCTGFGTEMWFMRFLLIELLIIAYLKSKLTVIITAVYLVVRAHLREAAL